MGIAATISMLMCGMAALFRRRSRVSAKAAQAPADLLETSPISNVAIWTALAIGAALTALSYLSPSISKDVFGLEPADTRKLSTVIFFAILGAANFNDGLRLRQLASPH